MSSCIMAVRTVVLQGAEEEEGVQAELQLACLGKEVALDV